jgi:hypothetical protein
MNHSTRKTDTACNVCGSMVEIVCNAASQCSNRSCLTREDDNDLSTDSTMEEQRDYWRELAIERDKNTALTVEKAEEMALEEFEAYIQAGSRAEAEEAEIRADTYLDHTDKGWGWLKEESDI